MSSEPTVCKGEINPSGPGNAVAKFVLHTTWTDPESGIPLGVNFNINSNSLVQAFRSTGAPEQRNLDVKFPNQDQPYGFKRFEGCVGDGMILIEIEGGIVVVGKIVGGPEDGHRFVGAGEWTAG
jgi:hypothetical protein